MLRKISSLLISLCLIFQQVGFASMATELNLAGHLSKMPSAFVADKFRPVHIRFFSFDAQNDNIKVMLDKGDVKSLKDAQINASTKELLNYFLVGITLPNDKFWVNLRPDSEDNIIDDWLAKTDVGKIMLEADLQLKKDTAQFTSPQTAEGKEYWNRLYKKAEELYGYQEVSIPTLTRPWIVPNEVIVRESKESAYIYKATLKVMLEQDFLKDSSVYNFKDARAKALNEYSSELIRELIIPKLTQEVNLSKRYAPLRQVYYSIVLSRWFKSRFNNQTGKYASRIDRKDLTGLASATAWSKSTYFDAYKKSFAQGEYNIKETVRTPTGQVIRSYFSGGLKLDVVNLNGGRASSAIEQSLLTAGLIRPGMAGDIKITSSPLMVNKNVEFLHAVPEAEKALANRNLKGINVLIRVNVNVPSKNGGIADPARIIKIKRIGEFILSRGGTPVFFGHNGSLDKKTGKDKRESLVNVAKYMRENFFPNLVFNENSITEQGVQIGWSDILQGAPNLLQGVRSADDYEVGPKRMIFAKSLARLAGDKNGKNRILIDDCFGDVGSDGASVGTIPFLMDEVYTGPEMVTEFNDLEQEVKKGFDVVLFGGIKAPKLASLEGLEAALNPDGFMFIASGLTPALKKMPDFLKKLQGENPERVLTTIDNSDDTTNDIGAKTLEMLLPKLDTLKPGQRVFVNGTMGNMEDKSGKYTAGTDKVWAKLKELAQRGVKIIVVGGDAGSTTVKYGLDKEPNVKTYSGGGVAFSYIANEDLVGLRALARRYLQLQNEAGTGKRFNVAFNGERGRMGPLYLQGVLENEKYAQMRIVAFNGIPLDDLDKFITKLTTPDTTYGVLFPGLEVKVIERNKQNKYAIIEINGFVNQDRDDSGPIPQRIVVLDDRKDAIRWNLVGEVFGEEYLTRAGILESSGQDLEWAKSLKRHLTAVPDGLVMYGAPPKGEGIPIAVLGVNEEEVEKDSQIISNASCTTNCIAPVAKVIHRAFGVIKAFLLTIHSETSDQASSETFRGDEPGRGRPGHKVQSPAKTGAATLLPKLIDGIGPNDGKAIRAGTLTGSVVVYSADLEKPATVKEIQDLFIQAAKNNPKVFGIGHNLSTKDIVKDPHSTIIDLDSIQVSPDGKKAKVGAWYDNEWGYAQRGLDMFLLALEKQENGERTKDFDVPAAAAKKETKPKTVPASDLEGLDSEGALPMFIPVQKSFTGKPTDLYLTGIKEKQGRNGQIVLRMLLGDPRFNLKAIVVEGITSANFEATMKAFAQSVLYSADLGNISGVKLTPRLTDKDEMYLVVEVGNVKRLVRVLSSLGGDIAPEAKVIDITNIKYSYAEMIKTIADSLKPTGAELLSATISMSTRPGGELLDSGKGISVAGNIIPMRINELDKTGIMYSAYQVPVDSGSYLVTTFTINGSVDKETIHKLIGAIPGIDIEETTSSDFVGHRPNMVYDKSQTVIITDKKAEGTMVSLFFLVNEELNAANKALEGTIVASPATASSAIMAAQEQSASSAMQIRTELSVPEGQPKAFFTNDYHGYTLSGLLAKPIAQIPDAVVNAIQKKLNQDIADGKLLSAVVKDFAGTDIDIQVTHRYGELNAAVQKLILEAMKEGVLKAEELGLLKPGVDLSYTDLDKIAKLLRVKYQPHSITERGSEPVVVVKIIGAGIGAANIKLYHEFFMPGATPLQKLGFVPVVGEKDKNVVRGFRAVVRKVDDVLKGNFDGQVWEFEKSAAANVKGKLYTSKDESLELLALASQPNDFVITAIYPVEGSLLPANEPVVSIVYQPVYGEEGNLRTLNPTFLCKSQSGADAVGGVASMFYDVNFVPGGNNGEHYVVTKPVTLKEARKAPKEGTANVVVYGWQSKGNGIIPSEKDGVMDHVAINPPALGPERQLADWLASIMTTHQFDEPYLAPFVAEEQVASIRNEQAHLFTRAPKEADIDPVMDEVEAKVAGGDFLSVTDDKADMGGKFGHNFTPEYMLANDLATVIEAQERGMLSDGNIIGFIEKTRLKRGTTLGIGDDSHILMLGDRSRNSAESHQLSFLAFTRGYYGAVVNGEKPYGLAQDYQGKEAKAAKANPIFYSQFTPRFFEILRSIMPLDYMGMVDKMETGWKEWQKTKKETTVLSEPFSGNVSQQGIGSARYLVDVAGGERTFGILAGDKMGPAALNRIIREGVYAALNAGQFANGLVFEIWDAKAFDEHGNIPLDKLPVSYADVADAITSLKNQADQDFVKDCYKDHDASLGSLRKLRLDEKEKLAQLLKKSGYVPTERIFLDAQKDKEAIYLYLADSDRFNIKQVWTKKTPAWDINNSQASLDRPVLGSSVTKLGILAGGEYIGKDDPVMVGNINLMQYMYEFLKTNPLIIQGDMNGSHWLGAIPTASKYAVANKESHPILVGQVYTLSADGKALASVEDIFGKKGYAPMRNKMFKFNFEFKKAQLGGQFEPYGTNWRTVEASYPLANLLRQLQAPDSTFLVKNKPEAERQSRPIGIVTEAPELFKVAATASSAVKAPGGIDFRAPALTIKYQPMGNFAGLNPKLPVLSKAELAVFNIDQELSGMEKLVNSQMVPSGDRLKEVLAACSQKGELGANKERLMALLVKIGIVEETQCCLQEASNEYKEALVLADSLA